MFITERYLKNNVDEIFVFGDNCKRFGNGGAAKLRDLPNTYGFITKKYPGNKDKDFYTIEEYDKVFREEVYMLTVQINLNPYKIYLISKLGSGLANRFGIYESIIEPNLKKIFSKYDNVKFLY